MRRSRKNFKTFQPPATGYINFFSYMPKNLEWDEDEVDTMLYISKC